MIRITNCIHTILGFRAVHLRVSVPTGLTTRRGLNSAPRRITLSGPFLRSHYAYGRSVPTCEYVLASNSVLANGRGVTFQLPVGNRHLPHSVGVTSRHPISNGQLNDRRRVTISITISPSVLPKRGHDPFGVSIRLRRVTHGRAEPFGHFAYDWDVRVFHVRNDNQDGA